jgi:hypothetical protein
MPMPKPAIKTYALTLSEPPNMRNKIFKKLTSEQTNTN